MLSKLMLLSCLVAAAHTMASSPRKRQRAEVIDGRVELEYQARITAVRKVIRETEFVTKTQTIIDSPYCVSYSKDLPACTPSDSEQPAVKPTRTVRRMAKSLAPDSPPTGSAPEIISSISDAEAPQIIELTGVNEKCINQNSGVTFLTTMLTTQTVTVTRTRPGAQTVTISIDGCLPSPMPFNAPTC